MVHMKELAASLKNKKAVVPASYLPWGKDTDFTGTAKATHIDADLQPVLDDVVGLPGREVRATPTATPPQGDRFKPDNVLVLRVREGDAGYLDPAGQQGARDALLRQGPGPAVPQRPGGARHLEEEVAQDTRCSSARRPAAPLKVPAGHVWIELVPIDKDGGKVVFRK